MPGLALGRSKPLHGLLILPARVALPSRHGVVTARALPLQHPAGSNPCRALRGGDESTLTLLPHRPYSHESTPSAQIISRLPSLTAQTIGCILCSRSSCLTSAIYFAEATGWITLRRSLREFGSGLPAAIVIAASGATPDSPRRAARN